MTFRDRACVATGTHMMVPTSAPALGPAGAASLAIPASSSRHLATTVRGWRGVASVRAPWHRNAPLGLGTVTPPRTPDTRRGRARIPPAVAPRPRCQAATRRASFRCKDPAAADVNIGTRRAAADLSDGLRFASDAELRPARSEPNYHTRPRPPPIADPAIGRGTGWPGTCGLSTHLHIGPPSLGAPLEGTRAASPFLG
jgi:hypothetical protein